MYFLYILFLINNICNRKIFIIRNLVISLFQVNIFLRNSARIPDTLANSIYKIT
jgi:hypothetical protein